MYISSLTFKFYLNFSFAYGHHVEYPLLVSLLRELGAVEDTINPDFYISNQRINENVKHISYNKMLAFCQCFVKEILNLGNRLCEVSNEPEQNQKQRKPIQKPTKIVDDSDSDDSTFSNTTGVTNPLLQSLRKGKVIFFFAV